MQNITIPTTAQPLPTANLTPAEKMNEAAFLVSHALRAADDEAIDYLSWGDRDRMSRQLTDALRLMREAREAITVPAAGVACCLACGEEEFGDVLDAGGCQTCALDLVVSN